MRVDNTADQAEGRLTTITTTESDLRDHIRKAIDRSALHRPRVEGIREHAERQLDGNCRDIVVSLCTYIEGLEARRRFSYLPPEEESASAAIRGALRSCIEAHGPITREFIASADKRVRGALLAQGIQLGGEGE